MAGMERGGHLLPEAGERRLYGDGLAAQGVFGQDESLAALGLSGD
jgi:hypothetical protein